MWYIFKSVFFFKYLVRGVDGVIKEIKWGNELLEKWNNLGNIILINNVNWVLVLYIVYMVYINDFILFK